MDPQDPALTLFILDDAADVGIASVLEALDHATGALRDVVVPSGRVLLDLASRPFLALYTFCILTIIFLLSLIARSRGKSRFLRQQKEARDRLVEEVRLRGEVTAQLVAAQQRVVELTSLAEEAANLRSRVAKARRDADEAEKAFEALSARSRKDDEEATRVRKERDELL